MFLFGRGLFCGWMCPFGSLQETIFKIAKALGLKRFQTQVPQKWHDRLKWLKYAVFFFLLTVNVRLTLIAYAYLPLVAILLGYFGNVVEGRYRAVQDVMKWDTDGFMGGGGPGTVSEGFVEYQLARLLGAIPVFYEINHGFAGMMGSKKRGAEVFRTVMRALLR